MLLFSSYKSLPLSYLKLELNDSQFNLSTKYGCYEPNCGLDNVLMSWGHDGRFRRALWQLYRKAGLTGLCVLKPDVGGGGWGQIPVPCFIRYEKRDAQWSQPKSILSFSR